VPVHRLREDHGRGTDGRLARGRELGDLPNQARTRLGLAQAAIGRGGPAVALTHTQAALDLYRAAGQPAGRPRR
jgi:hypothetical protein